MRRQWCTPLLAVSAMVLFAACNAVAPVDVPLSRDTSREAMASFAAVAGQPGNVAICHRTAGAPGFLLISVSARAVGSHVAHGDSPATTYHRDQGTDESLPATVVACERPDGYSEDPGSCTPVSSFYDGFDGAVLSPEWLTLDETEVPEICDGEACAARTQAAAYRTCIAPASSWTASFDFRAEAAAGREAYVMIAAGEPFASTTYFLGCDGGFQDPTSGGDTCGLTIGTLNNDLVQVFAGVETNKVYTLVATGTAAGALTVTLLDGPTTMHQLQAQVPPIALGSVGFVLGREDDGFRTYLDDFTFTSSP